MKEEIIKGFNNSDGFVKNNNFKIVSLDDKECTIEYNVVNEGLNPAKIVHGGLLFGLADTTAGTLACMNGQMPLTTSASIQYLNPARCKKLISTSRILKLGTKLGYYVVDIYDENNIMICTVNITMYFKDNIK